MADELQSNQVRLGGPDPAGNVYTLVPQRIARIGRKLPQVLEMFGMATGATPMATDVGPRLYGALKVFIPDLAPFWEIAGYPDEAGYRKREAWEAEVEKARKAWVDKWWKKLDAKTREAFGEKPPFEALPMPLVAGFEPPEFDDPREASDAIDKSPRPNEIMDAIDVIFELHGGMRLVRLLKNFMTPEAIRGMIERQIKTMQIRAARTQLELASLQSRSLPPGNGASGSTSSTTPERTSEDPGDLSLTALSA
jgi:hypothetical protein